MRYQDIFRFGGTKFPTAYLSPFCSDVCGRHLHRVFLDSKKIPPDTDIIGIAYFHNHYQKIKQELLDLLPRTSKLLVHLDEANDPAIFDLVSDPTLGSCFFFANMVPTVPNPHVQSVISWTCSGHNVYKQDDWAKNLLTQLDHSPTDHKKKFDCLLGSQKTHRDFVESCWTESPYRDQIIFSYYKTDPVLGIWKFDSSWIPPLPLQHIIPVEIYNQSLYSIVTESVVHDSFSFFTEKTAKPIIAKRPFVMFGGKHSLRNLRTPGFQTFSDVVDESYDDIENPEQRWSAAWQQVELLCRTDAQQTFATLESVLQHNHNHYMHHDWWAPLRQHFDALAFFDNEVGPYDLS